MTQRQENISCKKASVLMSKSLEQKLSIKEKAALMAHLTICKTCDYCYKQLKGIRKTLTRGAEYIYNNSTSRKDHLSIQAKERIKEQLNREII